MEIPGRLIWGDNKMDQKQDLKKKLVELERKIKETEKRGHDRRFH